MKIHPNGGGQVADTARVDSTAFVDIDSQVLDNAIVGTGCKVLSGSIIFENAILQNKTTVSDGAKVGGDAFLNATNIHSEVILTKTPITIHGFEQEIVVADDFIIVGCQSILIKDWETRSIALFRANGYPKRSAEKIRAAIDSVIDCYKSRYHEDDLKEAFKIG